jgi:7-carboxy-7-deazaguanine synthase
MINQQVAVAANYERDAIRVHSIFKTIQGEGPFSGDRALFIRLWGCNLRCPGCDTEYTSKSTSYTAASLVEHVTSLGWPRGALIVITGGEPFRQNVIPAIAGLLFENWPVQVETNGVMAPPRISELDVWGSAFTIVVSPKTSHINDAIASRARAFKYVLRAGDVAHDGLPVHALGHAASPYVARPRPGALVFVQPMDEDDHTANEANLHATTASCIEHGYRLQIQLHKYIDVP